MKVSQWAEIRRLAEVEKLSRRAIARRLGCCQRTVARALRLNQPPDEKRGPPRGSLLDPWKPKIDALLARYPELSAARVQEEICRGPDGYRGASRSCATTCTRPGSARRVSIRKSSTSRGRPCRLTGVPAEPSKSAALSEKFPCWSPSSVTVACATSNSACHSGRRISTEPS